MMEFIRFLDCHEGSLMVVITAIYVLATILICRANIKSAAATREQVKEMKRQYEEEHRPYISYQFIFERRTSYGMRFTNHGRRVANHVHINFTQDFLDSIEDSQVTDRLGTLREKEFTLGIEQSYDIFFGGSEFRENPNKKPIIGEISYQDSETLYSEPFEIDFDNYAPIFTVNSLSEDLHEDMKKQIAELAKIAKTVENSQPKK